MMKKEEIVRAGLGIAFVFIVTAFLSFPIGSFGYINIGDAVIMLFAMITTPFTSFFIGSIGSCLADFILAPQYAIFTFFIKGLEALIVSLLYKKWNVKFGRISFLIGGCIVIGGYALTDVILTQQPIMALTSIGFNAVQVIACIIIACIGSAFIKKIVKNKGDY